MRAKLLSLPHDTTSTLRSSLGESIPRPASTISFLWQSRHGEEGKCVIPVPGMLRRLPKKKKFLPAEAVEHRSSVPERSASCEFILFCPYGTSKHRYSEQEERAKYLKPATAYKGREASSNDRENHDGMFKKDIGKRNVLERKKII